MICLTVAVGIVFAILGAQEALKFLGKTIEFFWNRLKGFTVGTTILIPIWLIWWLVSVIIDKVEAGRARRAKTAEIRARMPRTGIATPIMKPICPSCGREVIDNGRYCRNCGWDFTRPIEEAAQAAVQSETVSETVVQPEEPEAAQNAVPENISEGQTVSPEETEGRTE